MAGNERSRETDIIKGGPRINGVTTDEHDRVESVNWINSCNQCDHYSQKWIDVDYYRPYCKYEKEAPIQLYNEDYIPNWCYLPETIDQLDMEDRV